MLPFPDRPSRAVPQHRRLRLDPLLPALRPRCRLFPPELPSASITRRVASLRPTAGVCATRRCRPLSPKKVSNSAARPRVGVGVGIREWHTEVGARNGELKRRRPLLLLLMLARKMSRWMAMVMTMTTGMTVSEEERGGARLARRSRSRSTHRETRPTRQRWLRLRRLRD